MFYQLLTINNKGSEDAGAVPATSTIDSLTKGRELTTYPTGKGFGVIYLSSVVEAVKI